MPPEQMPRKAGALWLGGNRRQRRGSDRFRAAYRGCSVGHRIGHEPFLLGPVQPPRLAPGVLKGDLYFYSEEHDMRETAKEIDTNKVPLYLLTGGSMRSSGPNSSHGRK
jgi:hypothetical protein